MKPYFEDYCGDKESLAKYRELLALGSEFLEELVRLGHDAIHVCIKKAQADNRRFHFTLLGLARHLLAYLDSANVLLSKGCVEACLPLLRSMLESHLGIAHIVQEKHEERALAYDFVRLKRRLKELRTTDKTHADGKQLEAELASDTLMAGLLDKMPKDLPERAALVEATLADPIFVPILAEWDRLKRPAGKPKQKDPEWFTLFGGGNNIRELAKKLGAVSLYAFIYKELSNSTHAGTALDGFVEVGGDIADIRQLRHPGGYYKLFRGVFMIFLLSFEKLLGFYDKQQHDIFTKFVAISVVPRFHLVFNHLKETIPTWYTAE
ncbi:MAG: DUF5677 domain-containing protein [Planctomycetes bacterium]|nr:DUF5677 domain-containing protein [Planctomycetota bacterium]